MIINNKTGQIAYHTITWDEIGKIYTQYDFDNKTILEQYYISKWKDDIGFKKYEWIDEESNTGDIAKILMLYGRHITIQGVKRVKKLFK